MSLQNAPNFVWVSIAALIYTLAALVVAITFKLAMAKHFKIESDGTTIACEKRVNG